jgi:RimJ/RimL family protein N-acetyltransferase
VDIIVETKRLVIREMDAGQDSAFIYALLNSPKFIKYIGDRGVRSEKEAAVFIETRYRQSYRDHGFGLYTVESKDDGTPVGICGFVNRDSLPDPDIGFAFLPDFERQGYGLESAKAMMSYGRDTLGFGRILAITTPDNAASDRLLGKIGFAFERLFESETETLRLYASEP